MTQEPWYKEGLHFECTGCGDCCTGEPGYVWVTPEEIASIAIFLDISPEECMNAYIRVVHGRCSLREDPTTYDCVFLKENKCIVYGARPVQCSTYPWWPKILETQEQWTAEAHRCEGICDNAPLAPCSRIEQGLCRQKENNEKF